MFAILLVGLVAGCAAAPHYHNHPPFHPEHRPDVYWNPYFSQENEPLFDTRRFWSDLATEMRELDTMLQDFYKKFPSITGQREGVQGDEYQITMPLTGFEEKEVVVKAREGVLMVQAVHKMENGGERSYLDVKTLPTYVNVTGTWTMENGVLKITFPLKEGEVVRESETPVTEGPVLETKTEVFNREHSREEMDSRANEEASVDADIGVREDLNKNRELFTNEIPKNTVEATTYAVDYKDEVEFVPVRY